MRAIVLGGYGVFGSLVCRELARRHVAVTVAGRDAARAEALAAELGQPHHALQVDAANARECAAALDGRGRAIRASGSAD